MKPDWDTLMAEYKDSKTALVADVDCTEGGKSLCEKHSVSGYPTIKWGDPTDLKDYDGGRELSAFRDFAAQNLGPVCGPTNLDLCDEADKKFIAKFQKWDVDELDIQIEEKEEKVKKIEAAKQKVVDGLNKQIQETNEKVEKETKKKDEAIAQEKKSLGYNYMKAVKASKTPKVDPDHDPDLEGEDAKEDEPKEDEL